MNNEKTNEELKKRLETIDNLYNKMGDIVDQVFDVLPEEWKKNNTVDKVKEILSDKILGDEELNKLLDSIKNKRAPRFMMVGRTGVGKSSLINAICDMYIADVSDVKVGTTGISIHQYKRDGEVVLEILDSRGIGESLDAAGGRAEEELLEAICDFEPDAILFVLNSASRDRIDVDVKELSKIENAYDTRKGIEIPTIAILNQVDKLAPSTIQDPSAYTPAKEKNIDEAKAYFSEIFNKCNFYPEDIIAVSSLMEWNASHEEFSEMPPSKRSKVPMTFDGRYKIDELVELIEKNIPDEAAAGLLTAARMQTVVRRVAKRFVKIFAGISGLIVLTPIPISDIFILVMLQIILVLLIAALSGEDISVKAARKFVLGAGGVSMAGGIFRITAQQLSKFANLVFPGAGSVVSEGIATAGTASIGNAAIALYIDGKKVKNPLSHKETE